MIVADTSVIAPAFLPSDLSTHGFKAIEQDPDWIAPRLWRSEFRNVLATHLRVQKISLESAVETMSKAENFFREREYDVSSVAVLQLSERSGASAYDCEYVALAQHFEISLVTRDKRLALAFPQTVILFP